VVYGAALQLLTVMVGYKYLFHVSHYSDELVVCFEHSLTKWAALTTRTCLHALTVCALELPISMRRMIPSVLVKLSQMASNPALALPMLELLSMLVHAADLSANFVEADYKRVFSVALQYLTAPVHMPPTAQDASALAVSATSQVATTQVAAYVRHLAMQILYVAYIGMRQADRRRYVPYITKGLLALQVDSSGRTSKGASQAALDEQREIILDLLARYTYANCHSKPTRSFVAEKLLEGAQSRRWVYGSSVLEISVAKGGWSEIVVRRSTGTVAWICRLENRYARGQRRSGQAKKVWQPNGAREPGSDVSNRRRGQIGECEPVRRRVTSRDRHAALAAARGDGTTKRFGGDTLDSIVTDGSICYAGWYGIVPDLAQR